MRNLPILHRLTQARASRLALVLAMTVLVYPLVSAAQDDLEKPPPIPPADTEDVPIPPKIQDEQLEPTVTIRDEDGRQIEEYRVNGKIYMVKVTPKGGVPYYYIDTDGDGKLELDTTQQALNPVQPVHWKIKEWK
jgi:hypothetical protein